MGSPFLVIWLWLSVPGLMAEHLTQLWLSVPGLTAEHLSQLNFF